MSTVLVQGSVLAVDNVHRKRHWGGGDERIQLLSSIEENIFDMAFGIYLKKQNSFVHDNPW